MGQPQVLVSVPAILLAVAIGAVTLALHHLSLRRVRRRIEGTDARERSRVVWAWVLSQSLLTLVFVGLLAAVGEYFQSTFFLMSSENVLLAWLLAVGAWLACSVTVLLSAKWGYGLFNPDDRLRWR